MNKESNILFEDQQISDEITKLVHSSLLKIANLSVDLSMEYGAKESTSGRYVNILLTNNQQLLLLFIKNLIKVNGDLFEKFIQDLESDGVVRPA